MKKSITIMLLAIITFGSFGKVNAQSKAVQTIGTEPKILVVYYSWSGNTRQVAEQIQTVVGGDIVEIKALKPYPEEYKQCVEQAKEEIHANFKPEININKRILDINNYDIIFIGSPNWWSTIAPPVASFINLYDFKGKTVIPFCTHGGGQEANLFKDIEAAAFGSKIMKGLAVSDANMVKSKEAVGSWLKELKIK
ncbi:MAG: NAD(P)H-dependent oxidoreductase [Bacteroidales bacterium]|jgi:flavodoxin|nr:NAD(P)H-dependent oxidoreductase [Bacteroidales bacterium]